MTTRTAEQVFKEDEERIASMVKDSRAFMVKMQIVWEGADTHARLAMLPGLLEVQAANPSFYGAQQVAVCNNLKTKYPPKKQYYGVKAPAPTPEPEQVRDTPSHNPGGEERKRTTVAGKPVRANPGKAKGGEGVQGLLF